MDYALFSLNTLSWYDNLAEKTMNQTYKLSGKQGGIFTLGFAIALPIGFLLSLLYSYISVYNPVIYLALIVWIGYAGGIAALVAMAVNFAKCRDATSAKIMGAVLGVVLLYTSWATFVHAFLGQNDGLTSPGLIALLLKPAAVFGVVGEIRAIGWYEVFGVRPTGGFQTIIWAIEALGIVGGGLLGGTMALHEKVYCESCQQWAKDMENKLTLSFPADDSILQRSIKGEIELLLDLPIAQEHESPQLHMNLKTCQGCRRTATLDFDMVTYTQDKDGDWDVDSEDLSPVFVLTNEQVSKFINKRLGKA